MQHAVLRAIVLLEHEVPYLDVAIAYIRAGIVGAVRILDAGIEEDLGAWTARAGRAHRPEVVFVEARDARGREPDLALPESSRFVVADVHRDVQFLGGDAQPLGEQLPREEDRIALVVVAETEVAQHLQERAVASRAADVLDIALRAGDAQAALHRHDPRSGRCDFAEESGHELFHPGDGEQRGGLGVGNQTGRGRVRVPFRDEEIDERGTELLRLHGATTILPDDGGNASPR